MADVQVSARLGREARHDLAHFRVRQRRAALRLRLLVLLESDGDLPACGLDGAVAAERGFQFGEQREGLQLLRIGVDDGRGAEDEQLADAWGRDALGVRICHQLLKLGQIRRGVTAREDLGEKLLIRVAQLVELAGDRDEASGFPTFFL